MYCSACGKEVADTSVFCPYCGNRFVSETVQPPQPVTPQAADTAATEPVSYGVQQTAPVQPGAESVYTPNYTPESNVPQQNFASQSSVPQQGFTPQDSAPPQSYTPQGTASQQGYAQNTYQGYEEPAKNVKDFAHRILKSSNLGSIKVAYIILYICAGITAVFGIINKTPAAIVDVLILGGLGAWLQLTYSKIPAILAAAYGVFNMLVFLIVYHRFAGWLILIAGIVAIIAVIPIHQKYSQYKKGMFNTNYNYQAPQQGYAYAPGQNYNAPGAPQPPQQNNYNMQNNTQPPQQNYYNR